MAKINICDICYKENKKVTPATKRGGLKRKVDNMSESFYLDYCDEHKSFAVGCEKIEDLIEKYKNI